MELEVDIETDDFSVTHVRYNPNYGNLNSTKRGLEFKVVNGDLTLIWDHGLTDEQIADVHHEARLLMEAIQTGQEAV